VDSIERSPQEDMLLVLFNTAISNLVCYLRLSVEKGQLLRTDRSFSATTLRLVGISVASFDHSSSASVLDPAANPSLFQSTLVIIIKVRNQQ